VDAVKIPYIVLPGSFVKAFHVNPGDLAIVYRPKTQAFALGVYADAGPSLGEASVKLHCDLKHAPVFTKNGIAHAKAGIDDPVATKVFPGTSMSRTTDAEDWNRRIHEAGTTALEKLGGLSGLQACAQ
jgi:hypothetical protein